MAITVHMPDHRFVWIPESAVNYVVYTPAGEVKGKMSESSLEIKLQTGKTLYYRGTTADETWVRIPGTSELGPIRH